ncbi:MAG: glycosyltransferase family 2 protein [Planctomycetota bacterium]|jgi:dolichol-phosphate mannosyltransferase
MRILVAIPVYNEQRYIERVIPRVLEHTGEVLVVDDGSTDATPMMLATHPVEVIRHRVNRGYGRSLRDAFMWAETFGYDWVITMDCDEQHEPDALPEFFEAIAQDDADIISGSRYITTENANGSPPADRRAINETITREINERLSLTLTDAFCGFKAHRVDKQRLVTFDENGYAFPMQLWVRAVAAGLVIREIPVRLIYNDPNRTFGGPLDDADHRLVHYRRALHCEIERHARLLPGTASSSLLNGCCG